MRDYWLTQTILSAIGWAYVALVLIALALALWLPKGKRGKAIAGAIVSGVASILPLKVAKETARQQVQVDEFRQRYAKAKALFDERCKTAGEKIYRTIENVDGILILNVRAPDRLGSRANPLWPDAALPHEATDADYIRNFLYWEHDARGREGERGYLNPDPDKAVSAGYRFVDVMQADGTALRYRLKEPRNRDKTDLVSEPIKGPPSRYAVGFVNQVKPEDRVNWVAGTTIALTDTQTNEVLATRESYSFEPGLGSKAGARQPWAYAITCPSFSGWDSARTRFFSDRVLKPKQGE